MKKFFVVSLAVLLCLGMTLPAVAKVKMGGMITQDFFYVNDNDDMVYSQVPHRTGAFGIFPSTQPPQVYPTPIPRVNPESSHGALDIGLPQALNRLNAAYSNDDNTIRGFIELRGGSGFGASNVANAAPYGNGFVWNYAWIDWVLSPKDFIRFGRQTQAFSIRAPNQFMGQNRGHIVGINFGNMNGGTSRDGVRWYHTFTDQVRFELAVYDPDNDGAETIAGFPAQVTGGNTATVLEENVLPRFDITAPLFFGNLSIWPSFTYMQQKYDNVGAGSEDKVTIWGLSVAGQYVWGPLSFNGEITFGKNLGAGNYVGDAIATPGSYALVAGGPRYINDADVTCWWFDLGWKIGPATIHGIVGNNVVKRKDDPTIALWPVLSVNGLDGRAMGSNLDRSLWMYGISVPIAIAKGFTIRPEIMCYDYDTNATVGNSTEVDYGKEYLVGVQFQLVF